MISVFYIFSALSAWFCQSRWEPVLQTRGVVLLLAAGDTGEGVLVSLVARWQKLNTGGWADSLIDHMDRICRQILSTWRLAMVSFCVDRCRTGQDFERVAAVCARFLICSDRVSSDFEYMGLGYAQFLRMPER